MRANLSRVWLALSTRTSPAPFLYQTRTLAAQYSTESDQSAHVRPTSDKTVSSEETPEPQSQPDSPNPPAPRPRKSYLQRRAASVSRKHEQPDTSSRRPAPTMTRSEKQVFGGLLEQFGINPAEPDEKMTASTIEPHRPPPTNTEREEMAQISAIFDSVLQDLKRKKPRPNKIASTDETPSAPTNEPGSPEIGENPGLEERLRSTDCTNADISEALGNNYIAMERAVELVVRRESATIEAALRATINEHHDDAGIWAVCKERIFSMLQHLEGGRRSAPAETEPAAIDDDPGRLDVPEEVPVEPVVVALYPKMLLVAFRLLNLHFPGSPLIDQFRATIKAQGRASAVLGSSTALYNELIYFYWRGCHDLPGVVSLLREMEVTGVEPSGRTCALLSGIARQRERDLKEHRHRVHQERRGALRQPWWDLAPNRRAVLSLFGPEGWTHRLERRVQERREREKVYSAS